MKERSLKVSARPQRAFQDSESFLSGNLTNNNIPHSNVGSSQCISTAYVVRLALGRVNKSILLLTVK